MVRIKFDFALIKIISLFQNLTRVDVKDCFESDGKMVFIVATGQIGKAIGKQSVNIKKLELKLKKKIRIIEFNPDPIKFVRGVVYPSKLNEVVFEDGIMTLTAMDSKTRGYLIGRAASNLRYSEMIMKRHFDVKELKVN